MKLRVILEISINQETLKEERVTVEQVRKALRLYSDDVADGFQLTTNMDGYDCTQIFFLDDGQIISTEIID